MKNVALFFIAIGSVFSYGCFAQSSAKDLADISSKNDLAIVYYHVEERINMNFGGSIRTYNVPNLDLITPKDLGENNTRKITPKYGKVRAKTIAIDALSSVGAQSNALPQIQSDAKINIVTAAPIVQKDFVNIDVVSTYERVMDKGYKSVDMLTKVADRHFFNGDMALAAKWYTELFNNKKDLEAVYYYRYARSLLDTGDTKKGNEMMQIFETKSL